MKNKPVLMPENRKYTALKCDDEFFLKKEEKYFGVK